MPRKEGMERKDLLKANTNIFKVQGAALDKFAKKTVKVSDGPRASRGQRECSARPLCVFQAVCGSKVGVGAPGVTAGPA